MHDVFICEFRRVLDFFHDIALIARTSRNQGSGIQNRVAPEVRHFFNQNGGISVQLRPNRCSHSAGAGTDNDNGCLVANINVGSRLLNRRLVEFVRSTARGLNRVCRSGLNCHGRQSGTGDVIYPQGLAGNDFGRNASNCSISDHCGFAGFYDFNICDLSCFDGYGNGYGTVFAVGCAFKRTVLNSGLSVGSNGQRNGGRSQQCFKNH